MNPSQSLLRGFKYTSSNSAAATSSPGTGHPLPPAAPQSQSKSHLDAVGGTSVIVPPRGSGPDPTSSSYSATLLARASALGYVNSGSPSAPGPPVYHLGPGGGYISTTTSATNTCATSVTLGVGGGYLDHSLSAYGGMTSAQRSMLDARLLAAAGLDGASGDYGGSGVSGTSGRPAGHSIANLMAGSSTATLVTEQAAGPRSAHNSRPVPSSGSAKGFYKGGSGGRTGSSNSGSGAGAPVSSPHVLVRKVEGNNGAAGGLQVRRDSPLARSRTGQCLDLGVVESATHIDSAFGVADQHVSGSVPGSMYGAHAHRGRSQGQQARSSSPAPSPASVVNLNALLAAQSAANLSLFSHSVRIPTAMAAAAAAAHKAAYAASGVHLVDPMTLRALGFGSGGGGGMPTSQSSPGPPMAGSPFPNTTTSHNPQRRGGGQSATTTTTTLPTTLTAGSHEAASNKNAKVITVPSSCVWPRQQSLESHHHPSSSSTLPTSTNLPLSNHSTTIGGGSGNGGGGVNKMVTVQIGNSKPPLVSSPPHHHQSPRVHHPQGPPMAHIHHHRHTTSGPGPPSSLPNQPGSSLDKSGVGLPSSTRRHQTPSAPSPSVSAHPRYAHQQQQLIGGVECGGGVLPERDRHSGGVLGGRPPFNAPISLPLPSPSQSHPSYSTSATLALGGSRHTRFPVNHLPPHTGGISVPTSTLLPLVKTGQAPPPSHLEPPPVPVTTTLSTSAAGASLRTVLVSAGGPRGDVGSGLPAHASLPAPPAPPPGSADKRPHTQVAPSSPVTPVVSGSPAQAAAGRSTPTQSPRPSILRKRGAHSGSYLADSGSGSVAAAANVATITRKLVYELPLQQQSRLGDGGSRCPGDDTAGDSGNSNHSTSSTMSAGSDGGIGPPGPAADMTNRFRPISASSPRKRLRKQELKAPVPSTAPAVTGGLQPHPPQSSLPAPAPTGPLSLECLETFEEAAPLDEGEGDPPNLPSAEPPEDGTISEDTKSDIEGGAGELELEVPSAGLGLKGDLMPLEGVEQPKLAPERPTLLADYQVSWKSKGAHFLREEDVRRKEDRKPTVVELASQRSIQDKISAWRLLKISDQLKALSEVEGGWNQDELEVVMSTFAQPAPPDHPPSPCPLNPAPSHPARISWRPQLVSSLPPPAPAKSQISGPQPNDVFAERVRAVVQRQRALSQGLGDSVDELGRLLTLHQPRIEALVRQYRSKRPVRKPKQKR